MYNYIALTKSCTAFNNIFLITAYESSIALLTLSTQDKINQAQELPTSPAYRNQ